MPLRLEPSATGVTPRLREEEERDPTGVAGIDELDEDGAFDIGRSKLSRPANRLLIIVSIPDFYIIQKQ